MDILTCFLRTCRKKASSIAAIDEGGEITYRDYARLSRRLATLLRIKARRKTIGIMLPTSKEFGITYFASLMAGRIPVPLNFLLERDELKFIADDSGIDCVVTVRHFEQLASGLASKTIFLEDLKGKPSLPLPFVARWKEDDVATILYTSGSTQRPKGVMLTHRNFMSNLEGCIQHVYFDDRDSIIGVLPMFHSFALTTALLLPVRIGARAVYIRRFSAPAVLEAIERHRVTAILAIASLYRVLIKAAKEKSYDLSSLRLCVSGGELLPLELSREFERTFGIKLLEGYGVTETAPVISVNTPDDFRLGTAGKPLPNVEVKIVDDDGNELPPGERGEILIRGPNVMKGYLNRPDLTRQALTPDGWYRTGDMGIIDSDGFLSIVGRKSDFIISSGENISPAEIEEVILTHPKVSEVAVIGVPDRTRGEVPKAFVILNEGETCSADELRDFCRGKLARFKIPRYFEFRDELPRGPTGKILKRALREESQ